MSDFHRKVGFATVEKKGEDAEAFGSRARYVGCADVAAAGGADVLVAEAADEQVAEGNGSQQVGEREGG